MSAQNVLTFTQKVANDPALQNQIKNLTPGDPNGLLKLASGLGFEFTVDELKAVATAQANELSDAELDQVAGGGLPPVGPQPILIGLLLPAVQPFGVRKAGERPIEY